VNIAICDDVPVQADILQKALSNCSALSIELLSISRFTSGLVLIDAIDAGKSFDLIFLDIQMPDESGISLYDRLNKVDTSIIFVSAYLYFLPEALTLRPPGFLLKPYTQDAFDRTVKSVLKQRGDVKLFTFFDFDRREKKLSCKEIYYLSVGSHFLYAHTDKAKYSVYGVTLKEADMQLSDYGFFRCSKSIIVNLRHCQCRKKNIIVFRTGRFEGEIIISRRKLRAFDTQILLNRWM